MIKFVYKLFGILFTGLIIFIFITNFKLMDINVSFFKKILYSIKVNIIYYIFYAFYIYGYYKLYRK